MLNIFERLLVLLSHKVLKGLLVAALLLVVLLLVRSTTWVDKAYFRLIENDPTRGAAIVATDIFGDSFTEVKYLDQKWSPADSLWFYTTTQGSDLLPYDFFLALEQEKTTDLFRAPENMNRYRYLPQRATRSNPDGLPVGMVADTYRGQKYMGFTCAACHTSQANYKGIGMRIDGGSSAADMDSFMHDLASSLAATLADDTKRDRFVAAILKAGNYHDKAAVEHDLAIYSRRLAAYNFFNSSPVEYGYARLDAFGRIYNRVLEHVMDEASLREVLAGTLQPEKIDELMAKVQPVLSGQNRDVLFERLAVLLNEEQRAKLRDKVFNVPDAPCSYPFLWDIPQHDYVQWNGIGRNAGVGPIGRNTGEVIGVFATLDWVRKKGWTISSVLGGQGFGSSHISFRSSADLHNLRQLEDRLETLVSPSWDDAVAIAKLPPLDPTLKARGEILFDQHCAECHAEIKRTDKSRRIVAHMDNVAGAKAVGTDPTMANNSVDYRGYSGILRNMYSKTDIGNILLNTKAPVAALLATTTENVAATPDYDKWFFTRAADWTTDMIKAYTRNEIKPSLKSGSYTPDTTAAPFQSLKAYKGRALNGIWATAPYLHNGSVPTLYDLLLPVDERPKVFMVGSRELDPKKVGFKNGVGDYPGFLFDTTRPGNHNTGHAYGTGMSDDDRWALVEYLKSL